MAAWCAVAFMHVVCAFIIEACFVAISILAPDVIEAFWCTDAVGVEFALRNIALRCANFVRVLSRFVTAFVTRAVRHVHVAKRRLAFFVTYSVVPHVRVAARTAGPGRNVGRVRRGEGEYFGRQLSVVQIPHANVLMIFTVDICMLRQSSKRWLVQSLRELHYPIHLNFY